MTNKLNTTASILEAMASFPGLGNQTVTFNKVTEAIADGIRITDIISNPAIAGIAPGHRRSVLAFAAQTAIAEKVVKPTRKSQLVRKIAVHQVADVNGHLVATMDFSKNIVDLNVQLISESHLADAMNGQISDLALIRKIGKEQVSSVKRMGDLRHVFYVDLWIPEAVDNQITEELKVLQIMQQRMVLEGFDYLHDGKTYHAEFLLQSASQSRTLSAVFIGGNVKAIDILRSLGHEPMNYAKTKGSARFVDLIKASNRPGLSASSAQFCPIVTFGTTIEDTEEGFRVIGGRFVFEVIRDRSSWISEGKYKVIDPSTGSIVIKDASTEPLNLAAGDGQAYCSPEFTNAVNSYFGTKSDAFQFRFGSFCKGLVVEVPNLRKYYDADLVLPESCVKGNLRNLVAGGSPLEFRVVMFNKSLGRNLAKTILPYQGMQGVSLTAEAAIGIANAYLGGIVRDLQDPIAMAKRAGVLRLGAVATDEYEAEMDRTLATTFATVMHHAPFALKDVFMQEKAAGLLGQHIDDLMSGSVAVDGNFKFMVADPYAILNARRFNQLDSEGRYVVPADQGMKAGTCFVVNNDETIPVGTEVAAVRFPLVTRGEVPVLTVVAPGHYMTKRAFRNLMLFNIHDLSVVRMGGADHDGDTCIVVTEAVYVKAAKAHANLAPVIDMGCPYQDPTIDNSRFTLSVDDASYDASFCQMAHNRTKEFVVRTLKPNKIGLLTNCATILADAVRDMAVQLAYANEDRKATLLKLIADANGKLDVLRLCQGWEIDRAKHGGAYEVALASQLEFIENPPSYCSYKVKEKSVWMKPAWMNYGTDQFGAWNQSVMNQSHKNMIEFRKGFDQSIADLKSALVKENGVVSIDAPTILGELAMAIAITSDQVKSLEKELGHIICIYKKDSAALIRLKIEAEAMLAALHKEQEDEKKLLDRRFKGAMGEVIDRHALEVKALEQFFAPEQIGLVAYSLTYRNVKAMKQEDGTVRYSGLSFPWTVAFEQLLAAMKVVSGNADSIPQRFVRQAVEFKLAIVCNPLHTQKVAERLLSDGELTFAPGTLPNGNVVYAAFVKGVDKAVGYVVVEDSYKLAASTGKLIVNAAKAGKSIINLSVQF